MASEFNKFSRVTEVVHAPFLTEEMKEPWMHHQKLNTSYILNPLIITIWI